MKKTSFATRRAKLSSGIALVIALLSITISNGPASATTYSFSGCNDRVIAYYFDDGGDGAWVNNPGSSNDWIDWARETLLTLNQAEGIGSSQLVYMSEVSATNPPTTATPIQLRWVNDTSIPGAGDIANINGTQSCQSAGNYLYINPLNASTKSQFQRTMQHEMGHLTGLRHSGAGDSADGHHPVMSTCLTNAQADAFLGGATDLKKDTRHHMNLIHDPVAGHQISVNPRFDLNLRFWQKNANMTLSTGGSGTEKYLKAKGNTTLAWQNYFYQSATIWDGTQTAEYGLRYKFKEEVKTNQSKVGYKTFFRVLGDYALTGTGCNSSASRYDFGLRRLNEMSSDTRSPEMTGWLLGHNSGMNWVYSDTWIQKNVNPVTPNSLNTSIWNGDGYTVQLRIHARSVRPSDGALRPIHFDDVTVMGDI